MKFGLEHWTAAGAPDRWDCNVLNEMGWGTFATVYGTEEDARAACAAWAKDHQPKPPKPTYLPSDTIEFEIEP